MRLNKAKDWKTEKVKENKIIERTRRGYNVIVNGSGDVEVQTTLDEEKCLKSREMSDEHRINVGHKKNSQPNRIGCKYWNASER